MTFSGVALLVLAQSLTASHVGDTPFEAVAIELKAP
jgi:hypothetical protein